MRLCKDGWLGDYIEYTKKTESPEVFHIWSAISAIAGALGRKCYVDRGFFTTYPNQYIILVASSALCKKGTAVEIALGIYNKAMPKYPATDRKPSMQKLIQNLELVRQKLGYSFCYLYNSELSTLFGRGAVNTDLMDFITAQYTCPDAWLYETASRGEEWVKECYLNFIGCTTPSDLAEMPASLVGGGLAGRILFIFSETPREPIHNPMKHYTPNIAKMKDNLIHDLKDINLIQKPFTLTKEADQVHQYLYEENFRKKDYDFRLLPYQGRKGEHLISLGMIISASRSSDAIIDEHDINTANAFLAGMESTVIDAFTGLGHEGETKHIDQVLKIIKRHNGPIPYSLLLKKMFRYANANSLQELLGTLMEANVIKFNTTNGKCYEMYEEGEL